jgi:hypothetical protein
VPFQLVRANTVEESSKTVPLTLTGLEEPFSAQRIVTVQTYLFLGKRDKRLYTGCTNDLKKARARVITLAGFAPQLNAWASRILASLVGTVLVANSGCDTIHGAGQGKK